MEVALFVFILSC